MRAMAQQGATLLASLSAGSLADRVFEPLMMPGGHLAPTVGRVLGAGPGRGVALLMTVIGVATLSTAALASLHPNSAGSTSARRAQASKPQVLVSRRPQEVADDRPQVPEAKPGRRAAL